MSEPKPMASLSSSLLARKGHAKPAMRPQGFGGFGVAQTAVEDLGWNDMGFEADDYETAPVEETTVEALPPVLRERERLIDDLVEPAPARVVRLETKAAPKMEAPRRVADATLAKVSREAQAKTGKAAFTLRLQPDRHLRLRLACAVRHCSAQILVTEALDQFLDSLPDVEALARRLPTPDHR